MNSKQAIVLAIGVIVAVTLVMTPRTTSRAQLVSSKTLSNGDIDDTLHAEQSRWQPVTFAVVVLATGVCVFSLRRKD